MKTLAAVVLVLLESVDAHAATADRVPVTNKADPAIRAEAMRVCATNQTSRLFIHAADACWTAFTLSLEAKNYADALQSVKNGCEKYGRGDHCLFLEDLKQQRSGLVPVAAGVDRGGVGEALQRAAELVNPVDIVDAELGAIQRRSSARASAQARSERKPR